MRIAYTAKIKRVVTVACVEADVLANGNILSRRIMLENFDPMRMRAMYASPAYGATCELMGACEGGFREIVCDFDKLVSEVWLSRSSKHIERAETHFVPGRIFLLESLVDVPVTPQPILVDGKTYIGRDAGEVMEWLNYQKFNRELRARILGKQLV
jgi:hypothetical protein